MLISSKSNFCFIKLEDRPELNAFDKEFFRKLEPRAVTKGHIASYNRINKEGMSAGQSMETISMGKPWKKHHKGNTREKLRRITSHLDA